MTWRGHVEAALEGSHPRLGRGLLFVLYALIVFSALSIGIETVEGLPAPVLDGLAAAEVVTVIVFTIEYVLRIAVTRRRLAYVFSFGGLIDLVAILPFHLSLGFDLRAARSLRLLRLFRLLKLARYTGAADRIAAAFRMVREELVVFGLVALVTLYLCAIGIYYFEHDAQPEAYGSVFDSMWWAAVTLTTVGYGDVYPVTVGGKIFTTVVLFIALGVIAVPTGLVSSALSKLRSIEK